MLIELLKTIRKMPMFAIVKVIIKENLLPKLSAKNVKKTNPKTFPIKSDIL